MASGLFALAAALAAPVSVLAVGDVVSSAHGYDVSFPQCGRPGPALASQFAVVGVNGGRPFRSNPCLPQEYGWALSGSARPQVYLNLEYGERSNGYVTCLDPDQGCRAYNFGYTAAENAFSNAYTATLGGSNVASIWWLDVETMNDWNQDTGLNGLVIKGALDYLRQAGRTVGIYSTPHQWREIAGGYTPPSSVGNWVVGDEESDTNLCGRPLWAGGQVWMFQWINWDADIDENHAC